MTQAKLQAPCALKMLEMGPPADINHHYKRSSLARIILEGGGVGTTVVSEVSVLFTAAAAGAPVYATLIGAVTVVMVYAAELP